MAHLGRVLRVQLTTGEPRTGLWCDACLLPSVIEVDVHVMCGEHGSHLFGTYRLCRDCGTNTTRKA